MYCWDKPCRGRWPTSTTKHRARCFPVAGSLSLRVPFTIYCTRQRGTLSHLPMKQGCTLDGDDRCWPSRSSPPMGSFLSRQAAPTSSAQDALIKKTTIKVIRYEGGKALDQGTSSPPPASKWVQHAATEEFASAAHSGRPRGWNLADPMCQPGAPCYPSGLSGSAYADMAYQLFSAKYPGNALSIPRSPRITNSSATTSISPGTASSQTAY